MKKTELVFILDRSGSMAGLESDTIGGYNGMLKRHQESEGDVYVTTVLFDDRYELLHNHQKISEISPITEKDYYVRGCTALYDAIGKTVNLIRLSEDKEANVIFVITTDGYENASHEYTQPAVQRLINLQKEKGWEFIFMGANIDAVKTARDIGIRAERATNFVADKKGVSLNFTSASRAIDSFLSKGEVEDDWACESQAYFESKKQ